MADTHEELIEFFKKSGANETQADTMARQMVKRAVKLSDERDWDETQAMEYLLKLFVEGRENSD
ncbi:MAG: hypothetical protein CMI18_06890 [Opitutaceae bacterium]|nr:hypothetical protein [Opitutaceae bacterium]|tara:strand:+ start:1590 stop:1781 length:192 start_codon:yes stop_codon:yes gene_type:complete